MYEIIDGCRVSEPGYFSGVFLFGDEGIPLQGNRVINRFTNFPDDQLLIWLMHHQNRELTRIDGVTLPLYGDWSFNFWHWCYEALPMALAAHEGGFCGTYLIPDIAFAADTLKLLGIRPDRIRCAEGSDYYLECMCLLDKRRGSNADLQSLSRIRSILRAEFAERSRSHRIYISRNGNPENMRKVFNEAELLTLLERFGFITLRLEDLPLSEQLAYTCNAAALVGPHGAGMTHCTFMPESSLVLEFFAPTYINPCIILACGLLKHRYYQLTSTCLHHGYPLGQDIEAPLPLTELTLTRELG
ncbi:MAG: hypothetical protein A2075_21505 [Geobacteraceae bacterium GWC2_58_44]|nr:MAG: hypothetical protein A2075_21505 [Geobacteraceae bacterium GWC2_58_44]